MEYQTNIFDHMFHDYKISKPIKLIELFAGYGSQNFALKYLNANYEHYKICEWAVPSIQAYNDAHIRDYNDYSASMDKESLIDYLYAKGISSNYNEPMKKDQISRKSEKWLRNVYNNIIATDNLVNIQQATGQSLEIVDKCNYEYVMTYSFPCQDLSLSGKQKGMNDTSTRSGMLWEVERILHECSEFNQLPQVLLMENVPQVHGTKNIEDFRKWILALEKLGYQNYWQDLNGKDYGIPQNRNRTFMISVLGKGNYRFPVKQKLELRLKDLLEKEVDDEYLLSKKIIDFFHNNEEKQKLQGNGFRFNVTNGNCIANCVTTKSGGRMDDNYIGHKYTYNIRKLTPKECFRLMGIKDEDFEHIAQNQSNSSLYRLAGDSIITNVLMAIFKQLF